MDIVGTAMRGNHEIVNLVISMNHTPNSPDPFISTYPSSSVLEVGPQLSSTPDLANFLASAIMIVLNVLFIAVLRWGVSGMLAATVIAQGGVALVFAARKRVWRLVDLRSIDRAYMGRLIRYSVPLIPNKAPSPPLLPPLVNFELYGLTVTP